MLFKYINASPVIRNENKEKDSLVNSSEIENEDDFYDISKLLETLEKYNISIDDLKKFLEEDLKIDELAKRYRMDKRYRWYNFRY